jgi:uncharacterized membrane protein YedE/YeeE
MIALASRFVIGLVFGLGLWLSGMTDPQRVLGFLDITGTWDPSLAFVMGSALAVAFVGYRVALRRSRPLLASAFDLPTASAIDSRLILGALIFGVGWGIAGYCPGPALSVLLVRPQALIFVATMITGMTLTRFRSRRQAIRSDG